MVDTAAKLIGRRVSGAASWTLPPTVTLAGTVAVDAPLLSPLSSTTAAQAPPKKVPIGEKFWPPSLIEKEFDEEGNVNGTGGIDAYHFGARMYDATIGGWMAADPMEEFWNSYSYCGANPINFVDPFGLDVDESTYGRNTNLARACRDAVDDSDLGRVITQMVNDPNRVYSDEDFNFSGSGSRSAGGGGYGSRKAVDATEHARNMADQPPADEPLDPETVEQIWHANWREYESSKRSLMSPMEFAAWQMEMEERRKSLPFERVTPNTATRTEFTLDGGTLAAGPGKVSSDIPISSIRYVPPQSGEAQPLFLGPVGGPIGLAFDLIEGTAGEKAALAVGVLGLVRGRVNPKIYAQLEKQYAKHGAKSIVRSLSSAQQTLKTHIRKLPNLKYKSAVKKTIGNVRSQIKTIQQFMRDNGIK